MIQYDSQFNDQDLILICERHPVESLLFASQKLTYSELLELYEYVYNMCDKLQIPFPKDCGFMRIDTDKNSNTLYKKITNMKENYYHLLVHLDVNEKNQTKRIFQRGRKSDTRYLTETGMEYLRKINLCYRALPVIYYDIRPETFCVFYRLDDSTPLPTVTHNANHK